MEYGVHLWYGLDVVQKSWGIPLAAEYLLDVYFTIRFLFFFRQEALKERIISIWQWCVGNDSDVDCYAAEQGCIWGFDLYRFLYIVINIYRKNVEKDAC